MSARKKPKASPKKVAAPQRQSAPLEKASRLAGIKVDADVAVLVDELGAMIDAARKEVAVAANAGLVTLYWQIGTRVRT